MSRHQQHEGGDWCPAVKCQTDRQCQNNITKTARPTEATMNDALKQCTATWNTRLQYLHSWFGNRYSQNYKFQRTDVGEVFHSHFGWLLGKDCAPCHVFFKFCFLKRFPFQCVISRNENSLSVWRHRDTNYNALLMRATTKDAVTAYG